MPDSQLSRQCISLCTGLLVLQSEHRSAGRIPGHCPTLLSLYLPVFYLFERWRVTQRFSIAGSLSLGPQKSTLGQAEARDPEFILGLLHEWQECNYLNHHMPPSRMFISRKLESEVELQLEHRDSSMVSRRPKQQLRCNTRYLPSQSTEKMYYSHSGQGKELTHLQISVTKCTYI